MKGIVVWPDEKINGALFQTLPELTPGLDSKIRYGRNKSLATSKIHMLNSCWDVVGTDPRLEVCSSFRICTFVCISRLLIVVEQVLGRLELVEALAIC